MSCIRIPGAIVLAVAVCAVAADDPAESKKLFDDLFAAEIARVERTPSPTDDIELAGRLFEATDAAIDRPAMLKILCEATVNLASKDNAGLPLAISAQERLVDLHQETPGPHLTKLMELRYQQVQTARGEEKRDAAIDYVDAALDGSDRLDSAGEVEAARDMVRTAQRVVPMTGRSDSRQLIADRLRSLGAKLSALSQAELLKKRLKANPQDTPAANELIKLYIVDLDDPGEAFKYSMLVDDKQLQANVKTATLDVEQVEPAAAMEAAGWYMGLTDAAREPAARLALLDRAAALYDRYIGSDQAGGLRLTKAELDRKKLQTEIDKIEAAIAKTEAVGGGPWIDVFSKIDLKDYTNRRWQRNGKALVCQQDDNQRLDFNTVPEGSFEYRVKLARLDGPGFVGIIFPVPGVEGRTCTFVAQGSHGKWSGLERINGQTFARNPSTGPGGWLPPGKPVIVRVVVRVDGNEVKIDGYVNNRRKTKWKGSATALSNFGDWHISGGLGVVADIAEVAVVSAEYRTIDK